MLKISLESLQFHQRSIAQYKTAQKIRNNIVDYIPRYLTAIIQANTELNVSSSVTVSLSERKDGELNSDSWRVTFTFAKISLRNL